MLSIGNHGYGSFANGIASCPVPHLHIVRSFPKLLSTRRWTLSAGEKSPMHFGNAPRSFCCCTTIQVCRTWRQLRRCNFIRMPFAIGESGGPGESSASKMLRVRADRFLFPPLERAVVKAIACEHVHKTGLPLSRLSTSDLTKLACASLGRPISPATVWRILDADTIKPWRFKYWIFPRDPQFADKAGPILDLYAGSWQGHALGPNDCILSADEKTSIQARLRDDSLPPDSQRVARIENEYERGGALQYLAGWDVRRGTVTGRCEAKTGIEPFGRLVAQVMNQEPYRSAPRIFWIVDNGSSHRGEKARRRLTQAYSNLILVHTPVHASWLNQVEIYFSIIQRKVLTPNNFASLAEVEQRLLLYEELSNREPRPFRWNFTRGKLLDLLHRIEQRKQENQQSSPAETPICREKTAA
jgi:DDE superfamily endonuclease